MREILVWCKMRREATFVLSRTRKERWCMVRVLIIQGTVLSYSDSN